MNHTQHATAENSVQVLNRAGTSPVVLVCEHASSRIPEVFGNLGLRDSDLKSHAAWDPGALAVAQGMSSRLDATLVAGKVSRLVYDCNRPPEALDAMPSRSETIQIPGNAELTLSQRQNRATTYYEPFRACLADTLGQKPAPVVVTIHSFTPVYNGHRRDVEIGILHDADSRLADAMLGAAKAHCAFNVRRNDPYGPKDGVTHTLKEHALPFDRQNVMIEIRNDLIRSEDDQAALAEMLAVWVADAISDQGAARCRA